MMLPLPCVFVCMSRLSCLPIPLSLPPLAAAKEEENEAVVSWVKAMTAADVSQHLGCVIAVATDHH